MLFSRFVRLFIFLLSLLAHYVLIFLLTSIPILRCVYQQEIQTTACVCTQNHNFIHSSYFACWWFFFVIPFSSVRKCCSVRPLPVATHDLLMLHVCMCFDGKIKTVRVSLSLSFNLSIRCACEYEVFYNASNKVNKPVDFHFFHRHPICPFSYQMYVQCKCVRTSTFERTFMTDIYWCVSCMWATKWDRMSEWDGENKAYWMECVGNSRFHFLERNVKAIEREIEKKRLHTPNIISHTNEQTKRNETNDWQRKQRQRLRWQWRRLIIILI